jgi:cysteinyl-tRNA synthetase
VAAGSLDRPDARNLLDTFRSIDAVFQIFSFSELREVLGVQLLLQQREKARQEKNWPLADKLRVELIAKGVCVQDAKN